MHVGFHFPCKFEHTTASLICCYYVCGLGAFMGVSLEGNIVATRLDTNLHFYGDPYLTTADILLGSVDRPKAAEPLYSALEDVYSKFG